MTNNAERDFLDWWVDESEYTTPSGHPWPCPDPECQKKRDAYDGVDDDAFGHCVVQKCHNIVCSGDSSGVRCHVCQKTYCKEHRDFAAGRECDRCGLWLCEYHCEEASYDESAFFIQKEEKRPVARNPRGANEEKPRRQRRLLCTYCARRKSEKRSRKRSLSPSY